MKNIWSVLCQNAIIDKDTNNVSLLNVVEEVHIPTEPPPESIVGTSKASMSPSFELVTLWRRSDPEVPEKGSARVRVVLPGKKVHILATFEVDLTKFLRVRNRLHIYGIPRGGEGIYKFVVERKQGTKGWSREAEVPLGVTMRTADSG